MLGRSLSCSLRLRRLPGSLSEAWDALRCTSSSAAAEAARGHPPAAAAAAAAAAAPGSGSAEAILGSGNAPDRVAKVLAHSFHKAPKETATALMKELSELDRIHLVLALQRHTSKQQLVQQETQYVDDLVKLVKRESHAQHSKLTRQQIHNAVIYQRLLQKFAAVSEEPPSWRQLTAVGLASGLPFVVFGILDNGIMLVAGEQIDHLFGAKLGLSVLASAGLGNMVADVVGVSATHTIQENMKRISTPPRLSMLQQQSVSYRAAQFMGAALGVAIGCLIGMTPLFLMEPGFFVQTAQAAADVAAGAAALGSSGGLEQAAGAAAAVGAAAAAAADTAAAAPELAGGAKS